MTSPSQAHAQHRFTDAPAASGEAGVGTAVVAAGAQRRGCWAAQQQASSSVQLLVEGLWCEVSGRPIRELAVQGAADLGGSPPLRQKLFDRATFFHRGNEYPYVGNLDLIPPTRPAALRTVSAESRQNRVLSVLATTWSSLF